MAVPLIFTSVTLTVVKNFISTTPAPETGNIQVNPDSLESTSRDNICMNSHLILIGLKLGRNCVKRNLAGIFIEFSGSGKQETEVF